MQVALPRWISVGRHQEGTRRSCAAGGVDIRKSEAEESTKIMGKGGRCIFTRDFGVHLGSDGRLVKAALEAGHGIRNGKSGVEKCDVCAYA